MRRRIGAGTLLVGAAALSGCVTPFAGQIRHDPKIANAPGTIVLGEPRIFSREDLISERAHDVVYLRRLIAESEDPTKISFKPELYRELETITAFAFALGVKVDPLSGVTNRRSAATGEMLYEIDRLKLQYALDQLKRDIELKRATLAAQTEPVNTGLGTVPEATTAPATVTVTAVDQLKAAIDKLQTAITDRLGADGKPPAQTTVTSNPFDEFRDRTAYRNMLKGELNAASLDQLHDAGNAKLMRLNFEASVMPVEKYKRSLGAVQVRVIPPGAGSLTSSLLENWLTHLNTDPRVRAGAQLTSDPLVTDLIASGGFKTVAIGSVTLLLPVMREPDGREWAPEDIIRRAQWDNVADADQGLFDTPRGLLSDVDPERPKGLIGAICTQARSGDADQVERALLASRDRDLTQSFMLLADQVARNANLASPLTDDMRTKLERSRSYGSQVGAMMERDQRCQGYLAWLNAIPEWKAFTDAATGAATTARVYQVGPREQVQQVSSVARGANSFALAASVAGNVPNSGVAADAAASYSRQAMGRASALERNPLVSGYAVGGDQAFGWVVGPRVVLDPRGKIEMEQVRETYDVWVDLSVPGWWGDFDLEAISVWAPSPTSISRGSLSASDGGAKQRIKVRLVRSASDYEAITDFIVGNLERRVVVGNVQGGPGNACTPTTLWITGDNLWRAESVFLLGQLLKREQFSITPDMRGIMLTVPAITSPPNVNLNRTLSVLTPLGPGVWSSPIEYLAEPKGDACKPAKPEAAAAVGDAATFGEIKPALEFMVPAKFSIQVSGTNLKKVTRVELHGQAGGLKVAADGKSLTVDFDENSTSAIPTSDNVALEFLDTDKKVLATRRVRIQRSK